MKIAASPALHLSSLTFPPPQVPSAYHLACWVSTSRAPGPSIPAVSQRASRQGVSRHSRTQLLGSSHLHICVNLQQPSLGSVMETQCPCRESQNHSMGSHGAGKGTALAPHCHTPGVTPPHGVKETWLHLSSPMVRPSPFLPSQYGQLRLSSLTLLSRNLPWQLVAVSRLLCGNAVSQAVSSTLQLYAKSVGNCAVCFTVVPLCS